MRESADFLSANHGTIITLAPQTDAAQAWADENLAADPDLPGVVNIEPRYFLDIACAILADGLSLQDMATGRMARLPADA